MASAAPILVGYLASNAVAKIGESQGWDPMLTTFLSVAAGAGAGSIGAGASAAAGAGSGATNAFNPATTGVMAGRAVPTTGITSSLAYTTPMGIGGIQPHVSSEMIGVHPGITGDGGLPGIWNPGTSVPANEFASTWATPVEQLSGIGLKSADPTGMISSAPKGELFASATKDAWSSTWKDPEFVQTLGMQMIDGLFAEPPRRQSLGGGGGGGGSMAPAYQGGGGGQYQLIQSFPQRGTSIQWQEVA